MCGRRSAATIVVAAGVLVSFLSHGRLLDAAQPTSEQWTTLGSVDPASPYTMLATLANRGAAVERVEPGNPTYRDLVDRSGYLGHLFIHSTQQDDSCRVDVVGAGTHAQGQLRNHADHFSTTPDYDRDRSWLGRTPDR